MGGAVSTSRSLAPAQAGTAPGTAQVLVRTCFPFSFWNQRMFFLLEHENSSKGGQPKLKRGVRGRRSGPSAHVHPNRPRSISKLGRRRALAADRLPSHCPPLAGPPRSRSAGFPWGSHTFVQRKHLRGRRDSRLGESSRVTSPPALLFRDVLRILLHGGQSVELII